MQSLSLGSKLRLKSKFVIILLRIQKASYNSPYCATWCIFVKNITGSTTIACFCILTALWLYMYMYMYI